MYCARNRAVHASQGLLAENFIPSANRGFLRDHALSLSWPGPLSGRVQTINETPPRERG